MYKDYYKILEIHFSSSQQDIKRKYRELARKWHPDVNATKDTTSIMQEIVEAYLILSDTIARQRYDLIHEQLFRTQNQGKKKPVEKEHTGGTTSRNEQSVNNESGIPFDPILEKWILNARKQATSFIIQSLKDAKGITVSGCKYTMYAIVLTLLLFIVLLIVLTIARATQ